jgi:hypothetical protein
MALPLSPWKQLTARINDDAWHKYDANFDAILEHVNASAKILLADRLRNSSWARFIRNRRRTPG